MDKALLRNIPKVDELLAPARALPGRLRRGGDRGGAPHARRAAGERPFR